MNLPSRQRHRDCLHELGDPVSGNTPNPNTVVDNGRQREITPKPRIRLLG